MQILRRTYLRSLPHQIVLKYINVRIDKLLTIMEALQRIINCFDYILQNLDYLIQLDRCSIS